MLEGRELEVCSNVYPRLMMNMESSIQNPAYRLTIFFFYSLSRSVTSRSVTRLRRPMTESSLKQLVPPLSQKQTDEILVYFWVPDGLLLFRGRAKPCCLEDALSALQNLWNSTVGAMKLWTSTLVRWNFETAPLVRETLQPWNKPAGLILQQGWLFQRS